MTVKQCRRYIGHIKKVVPIVVKKWGFYRNLIVCEYIVIVLCAEFI